MDQAMYNVSVVVEQQGERIEHLSDLTQNLTITDSPVHYNRKGKLKAQKAGHIYPFPQLDCTSSKPVHRSYHSDLSWS